MRRVLILFALLLTIAPMAARAQAETPTPTDTIADILAIRANTNVSRFSAFHHLLDSADPAIMEALADPELEYTIFVPGNDAIRTSFDRYGLTEDDLFANPDLLDAIVRFHITPALLPPGDFMALDYAFVGTMLPGYFFQSGGIAASDTDDSTGFPFRLDEDDPDNLFGQAYRAANGWVIPITELLLPNSQQPFTFSQPQSAEDIARVEPLEGRRYESLSEALSDVGGLSIAAAIVEGASEGWRARLERGGPYTLFVPSDGAFERASEDYGYTLESFTDDEYVNDLRLNTMVYPGQLFPTFPATISQSGVVLIARRQYGASMLITTNDLDSGFSVYGDYAQTIGQPIVTGNGTIFITNEYLPPG